MFVINLAKCNEVFSEFNNVRHIDLSESVEAHVSETHQIIFIYLILLLATQNLPNARNTFDGIKVI